MITSLDYGFYINLFEIKIEPVDFPIMVIKKSKYPELKVLRKEIDQANKEIYVYAPEKSENIYGFGKDMNFLATKGFNEEIINLYNEPRLTTKIILESYIKKAKTLGFQPLYGKGRYILFNWNDYKITSDETIKIFLGYDIRVIFLKDQIENNIVFGIIIDITYSLKDVYDKPLNFSEITSHFGNSTLREIRQIQRDLIPTGFNREISRQRLIEDIIPFIEKFSEIELPCGLIAQITPYPTRIILGGEDETIW